VGFSQQLIERSGYAGEGFAEMYDQYRPGPPPVVLSALMTHAGTERPELVVDLGCGTGLSSRAWADRAVRVVGVEGNPSMAARARAATTAANVAFVERLADDTGLPAAAADVVTCAQSFHWMEPGPVLAEAARILRCGGVFAAYDYDVVPVIEPEVDAAFAAHVAARSAARSQLGIAAGAATWPKSRHIVQIRESGHFRHAREMHCHGSGTLDATQLVGLAHSIGGPIALFDGRAPEVATTLEALRETAARVLGDRPWPALTGYTIRLGVR
jgi:ubiquinone/menaquinone biosynthesis C-methylase UbiE